MLPQQDTAVIIKDVKINQFHSWQITRAEARQMQRDLAVRISRENLAINPRYIGGFDISAPDSNGIARAAAVILNYPELEVIEVKIAQGKLDFPYIPGLLSFRETPLILAVCQELSASPDLIMVDGQGIAHPRRFGIASHLGLLLDIPTIGCAKSRLCGAHPSIAAEAGAHAELVHHGETIGMALRTKIGTNPVYVSVGHKIDLQTSVHWVMQCCHGRRLPEPTRLAHMAASGKPISIVRSQRQSALT
jgi:deoxyribonuclease V